MCAMVTAVFACGVSAAKKSTEESAEVSSEEIESTTDDTTTAELLDEPEIIHIADGEEFQYTAPVLPKQRAVCSHTI